MPTIFSFSNGEEQQPKRRCLVSINEVVSGIPVSAVNSREEVAYVDNGSSANSLAANQSNVMMLEDTSEQAFVAQGVVHDDIALTVNVCEDVGLVSSVQHTNRSGKLAHLASGHSYIISAHMPSSSLSDHCYYILESPKTLKRKAYDVKDKLCVAHKKTEVEKATDMETKGKSFFLERCNPSASEETYNFI